MQSVNNKALIEELDKLVGRLRVPSEVYYDYYPSFSLRDLIIVMNLVIQLGHSFSLMTFHSM